MAVLAAGCGDRDRGEGGLTGEAGGDITAGLGTDGPGTSGTTGTGSGDGSSGDGVRLDLGGGGTGGPGEGGMMDGCQKIDFLFVIDNSGSMEDEQANLITSFPGFISTIRDTLDAEQYHIMAISTDNADGTGGGSSSCQNGDCGCTPAPVCCQNACGGFATTCNGFDCNNLPIGPCDTEWGTGKMYDQDGNFCNLADGRRYMLDTQPDLDATFACIANVGTYGSGAEKPMFAMGTAISAALNDAGGCNEGFLRDDAILVVVVITDEEDDNVDDDGSPGEPMDWYNALVDAKGGNPDAVVMLGLVGDSNRAGGFCPAGGMPGNGGAGAEDGLRLQEVTEMFQYGVVGSVCGSDYTPFFERAVSVIDASCEDFFPPG